MKASLIISFFLILVFYSCENMSTQDKQKSETPKALEDKSSSYEIISKRGYDNLVESLYKELTDKTPELKDLESQIKKLADGKSDSAALFNKFNAKNESYYNSAIKYTGLIKDTLLKEKISLLIQNSMSSYNSSTLKYKELVKSIDNKYSSLNDLHLILKITRTLPLMEKYQKDLPSTKSLEGYEKQLDRTIRYTDSLSKK